MFQVGKCAPGPWERSLSPSRSSGHSSQQAASAREGRRRRVRGPGSSFLQNLGGLSCAWGGWPGMTWGVSSQGKEGPMFLSSSRVIKSSRCQCEPKPHSPAEPSGKMERGFHGYHAEENSIQITPKSKVHPVSFSLNLVWGQGSREGQEVQGRRSRGTRGHCALPTSPTPLPR